MNTFLEDDEAVHRKRRRRKEKPTPQIVQEEVVLPPADDGAPQEHLPLLDTRPPSATATPPPALVEEAKSGASAAAAAAAAAVAAGPADAPVAADLPGDAAPRGPIDDPVQPMVIGPVERRANPAWESARADVARLQADRRVARLAGDLARTGDPDFPLPGIAARPAALVELVHAEYRSAVRAVCLQARERFLAASPVEPAGVRDAYNAEIVTPAITAVAIATRQVRFGELMPVPSGLLKSLLREYAVRGVRRDPEQALALLEDAALAELSTAELEFTLRELAAWPEYERWYAEIEPAPGTEQRIRDLAGLHDATGMDVDDPVFAAARVRRPFSMQKFEVALDDAIREAVFARRRARALDERAYTVAVARGLTSPDIAAAGLVLALPLVDRAARIFTAAARVPGGGGDVRVRRPDDLIAVVPYTRDPESLYDLSAALDVNQAAAKAVDDPTVPEAGAPGNGELVRRLLTLAVDRLAAEDAATRFAAAERAAVQRLESIRPYLDVPLVAERHQHDPRGFRLHVTVRNVPDNGVTRLVWRKQQVEGGPPQDLRSVDVPGGALSDYHLDVVSPGVRAYSARDVGLYWAELRGLEGARGEAIRGQVAELRVWATCIRDGARFALGQARVHGECTWSSRPGDRNPGSRNPAEFIGGIDVQDSQAVLAVTRALSQPEIRTKHFSLAATVRRAEAAAGDILLLSNVKRELTLLAREHVLNGRRTGLGQEYDLEAALLAAVHIALDLSLRATSLLTLPLLSLLAFFRLNSQPLALANDDARWLLEDLPHTVLASLLPGWVHRRRVLEAAPSGPWVTRGETRQWLASQQAQAFRDLARRSVSVIAAEHRVWAPEGPCGEAVLFFANERGLAVVLAAAEIAKQELVRPIKWRGRHTADAPRFRDDYVIAFSADGLSAVPIRGSERVGDIPGSDGNTRQVRERAADRGGMQVGAVAGVQGALHREIERLAAEFTRLPPQDDLRRSEVRAAMLRAVNAYNRAQDTGL